MLVHDSILRFYAERLKAWRACKGEMEVLTIFLSVCTAHLIFRVAMLVTQDILTEIYILKVCFISMPSLDLTLQLILMNGAMSLLIGIN